MDIHFILIFILVISFSANAQEIEKTKLDLSTIQNIQQANEYLTNHPSFSGQLYSLNSNVDTTDFDKELLATRTGDLIDFGSENEKKYFFFKTIETTQVKTFRVQYIFLDNKKITLRQIDSLRTIILKRFEHGESFDRLAKEYSMDGNAKNGGDLGWFEEGMMQSEFEAKVKSKKIGEVFTVDIPAEKWYYVVRNSHNPMVGKKVTILYLEIKSGP